MNPSNVLCAWDHRRHPYGDPSILRSWRKQGVRFHGVLPKDRGLAAVLTCTLNDASQLIREELPRALRNRRLQILPRPIGYIAEDEELLHALTSVVFSDSEQFGVAGDISGRATFLYQRPEKGEAMRLNEIQLQFSLFGKEQPVIVRGFNLTADDVREPSPWILKRLDDERWIRRRLNRVYREYQRYYRATLTDYEAGLLDATKEELTRRRFRQRSEEQESLLVRLAALDVRSLGATYLPEVGERFQLEIQPPFRRRFGMESVFVIPFTYAGIHKNSAEQGTPFEELPFRLYGRLVYYQFEGDPPDLKVVACNREIFGVTGELQILQHFSGVELPSWANLPGAVREAFTLSQS